MTNTPGMIAILDAQTLDKCHELNNVISEAQERLNKMDAEFKASMEAEEKAVNEKLDALFQEICEQKGVDPEQYKMDATYLAANVVMLKKKEAAKSAGQLN